MKNLLLIISVFILSILELYPTLVYCDDETDIMGVCPTKIICGNSRITMDYSQQGKLVAFYTPTVGSYNIIPYTTTTDTAQSDRLGSPEHEGVFAGIYVNGVAGEQFKWLWQLPVTQIEYKYPTSPTIQFIYNFNYNGQNVQIVENCLAGDNTYSFSKVGLETYNVVNQTSSSINVRFVYYGFIHPTIKSQQPMMYLNGSPVYLLTGWDYSWPGSTYAAVTNNEILVEPSVLKSGQYIAIGASEGNNTTLLNIANSYFSQFNLPLANPPYAGVYTSSGPNTWISGNSATGSLVNWSAVYDLSTIIPNGSQTINVFISSANSHDAATGNLQSAVNEGSGAFESYSESHWSNQNYLQVISNLPNLSSDEIRLLKRWTITSRMMVDDSTGAIIASPNRQPKYYSWWVRDGMNQCLLWEALGETNIVDNFIGHILNNYETASGNRIYWKQSYGILHDIILFN